MERSWRRHQLRLRGLRRHISPTLFIGGMCGFFLSGLAADWLPLTETDHVVLAGVGMCTCLCSVIRAPLTSMLIVFEMTHEFAMVPALMLGVIVCEAVTRLFGNQNFYTSLLLQDGHELVKIHPPRNLQAWQAIEAGHLMNTKVVASNRRAQGCRRYPAKLPYRCFPVNTTDWWAWYPEEARIHQTDVPRILILQSRVILTRLSNLSEKFIQSPAGFLIVTGRKSGRSSILTLHDLCGPGRSVLEE